jgi:hypothetical protein
MHAMQEMMARLKQTVTGQFRIAKKAFINRYRRGAVWRAVTPSALQPAI